MTRRCEAIIVGAGQGAGRKWVRSSAAMPPASSTTKTAAYLFRHRFSRGIHTLNLKRAHRVARALRAGTVWVNTYNMFDATTPFGGYKSSGFGREGGPEVMENYTQYKSVWIDLS